MPPVDAISGVDALPPELPPLPPPPTGPGLDAESGPLPESVYIDPLDPSSWGKPIGAADLYDMGKRDPVAYAQHMSAMQESRDREEQRLAKEREDEFLISKENDERDLKDVLAEAQRRQQALLTMEVDPKRFYKNQTVTQSIMSFLSVVIGGLYASRKGGPNIGLEILDRAVDRDIAAQQANIGNARSAIAELRAAGMSDFEAKQAIRIGAYKQALGQIQAKMQDFDPAGSTAARMAQQALEVEGRIAQAAEAGRRNFVDEELKRRKDQRETLETMAKLREADAKLARSMGGIGGAPSKALDKQKFGADELGLMFPGKPLPTDGIPRTIREYDQWVATASKGEELISKQRTNAQFDEEQDRQLAVRGPDGKFLLGDDEKPVRMKDVGEAKELTKSIADTDEYLRMMDEVLRLRKKYGWSSDLVKSPEWRKVKTLWGEAVLQKKDVNKLGALTGPDLERLHEAMGSDDPTSLRDPTPGIETARQSAVEKLKTNLRTRGVGEKHLPQYPETWKKQAPIKTAIDEAISELVKAEPSEDHGKRRTPLTATDHMIEGALQKSERYRDKIKFLEEGARADGESALKARQGLAEISATAPSKIIQQWATDALRNLAASEAATKEEVK